jgi:phosphate starvation-inducible PhoH-like protein
VAAAVRELQAGRVQRIVLTRPAVEAGERLGFLPGDFEAKVNPYLRPLYDALRDILGPTGVRRLRSLDLVEIAPLAFMRGRTLARSFIILDEAQNCTPGQMKMFLTRLGEGSRAVVTGDLSQTDLVEGRSGLEDAIRRLRGVEGIAVIEMTAADIQRSTLVQRVVEAYGG